MREPDDQFAFDRFRLDPAERRLFDREAVVPLRDKVFDTLLVFVRNAGHLLSKQELLDSVWPDRHVEESNLNHNISVLRKALGDTTDSPRFIETVPKRGFRFVAEVRRVPRRPEANDSSIVNPSEVAAPRREPARLRGVLAAGIALALLAAAAWAVATRHDDRQRAKVVVVVPLRYLSASPQYRYIATSISATLATRLGAIGGVSVRPATAEESDARLILGRSGTDAVVGGTVQSVGQNIRITADLYDGPTGSAVWSRQFDIAPSEILVLEDAIAQAVGDHVRPGLAAEERAKLAPAHSHDDEAVEEYVRGRDLLDRRVAIPESEEHLQRAVTRDPQFAAAWAALAEAKMYPRAGSVDVDGAAAAAHRALRLDGSLAEAHAALGFIDFFYRWDWGGAERELRTAIHLNPGSARAHDWYALTLAVRGSIPAALAELDRARQIDPRSLDMANDVALLHLLAHDYAQAERAARAVLEIDPSETQARAYRIGALLKLKRFDEAIAESAAQTEQNPLREVSREVVRMEAGRSVDRARLIAEVARLESSGVPPEHLAALYARLGERDKALKMLTLAYEQHSFGVVFLANNVDFEILHGDPRFTALLRRIGIAQGPPSVASVGVSRSAS